MLVSFVIQAQQSPFLVTLIFLAKFVSTERAKFGQFYSANYRATVLWDSLGSNEAIFLHFAEAATVPVFSVDKQLFQPDIANKSGPN